MATQTIEFTAPAGKTLTLKVFALQSDTVVDSVSATNATNRGSTYTAAFTDLAAGVYNVEAFEGSVSIAKWQVNTLPTTGTFTAYEPSPLIEKPSRSFVFYGDSRTFSSLMTDAWEAADRFGYVLTKRAFGGIDIDTGNGGNPSIAEMVTEDVVAGDEYDYALFMTGVNSFKVGTRDWESPLNALEDTIEEGLAGGVFGHVFVLTDAPRVITIDTLGRAAHLIYARELARRFVNNPNVTVVDSWSALSDSSDPSEWFQGDADSSDYGPFGDDGVHWTVRGYNKFFSRLMPIIEEVTGDLAGDSNQRSNAQSITRFASNVESIGSALEQHIATADTLLDMALAAAAEDVTSLRLKANADTFYVDPTGSDLNSGESLGEAWLTPSHAYEKMTDGSTVIFSAGTYTDRTVVNREFEFTSRWIGAGAGSTIFAHTTTHPLDFTGAASSNFWVEDATILQDQASGSSYCVYMRADAGTVKNTNFVSVDFKSNASYSGSAQQIRTDCIVDGIGFTDCTSTQGGQSNLWKVQAGTTERVVIRRLTATATTATTRPFIELKNLIGDLIVDDCNLAYTPITGPTANSAIRIVCTGPAKVVLNNLDIDVSHGDAVRVESTFDGLIEIHDCGSRLVGTSDGLFIEGQVGTLKLIRSYYESEDAIGLRVNDNGSLASFDIEFDGIVAKSNGSNAALLGWETRNASIRHSTFDASGGGDIGLAVKSLNADIEDNIIVGGSTTGLLLMGAINTRAKRNKIITEQDGAACLRIVQQDETPDIEAAHNVITENDIIALGDAVLFELPSETAVAPLDRMGTSHRIFGNYLTGEIGKVRGTIISTSARSDLIAAYVGYPIDGNGSEPKDGNELLTEILEDTGTTLPALISASGSTGPGAIETEVVIKSITNVPIADAHVWLSTDSAGLNVVAGSLTTNDFGIVTFFLDVGTYYRWADHSEHTFTNPQTLTVT